MTTDGVQVLGLCRWSYPSELKAFNIDYATEDALRAYLYSPERMALRLFLLEHVVLPCLRVQTDADFTLVLMAGDRLPARYRDRLLALTSDIPQIRLEFLPEGQNHRRACRAVMQRHRDPDARAVAEFRLDDDDAVAAEFVARTRSLFTALRPVFRENKRVALDFCRGFVVDLGPDGIRYSPVLARYWTPALVLFLRPGNDGSLLDYPHVHVWKRMPTLTWQTEPMFLRGAHGDNDSALSARGNRHDTFRYDLTALPGVLRDRFGVDIAALEDGWARLREDPARVG